MKVTHIFLSHCHIDHFFGFDLFLRLQIGTEKTVTLVGPPETSSRVQGKLKGYTWNLVWDKNLEFVAVDLDPLGGKKTTVHFRAKDGFSASDVEVTPWSFESPVFDERYIQVFTRQIDHRTPSLAYFINEKPEHHVNETQLDDLGFVSGPWLGVLKDHVARGDESGFIRVPRRDGSETEVSISQLARWLVAEKPGLKLAYVTDGAAHDENFQILLPELIGADFLFAETCFVEKDRLAADETKHFTAEFMGNLAAAAKVKTVVPFHFSKRYMENPEQVFDELAKYYHGELIRLDQYSGSLT